MEIKIVPKMLTFQLPFLCLAICNSCWTLASLIHSFNTVYLISFGWWAKPTLKAKTDFKNYSEIQNNKTTKLTEHISNAGK